MSSKQVASTELIAALIIPFFWHGSVAQCGDQDSIAVNIPEGGLYSVLPEPHSPTIVLPFRHLCWVVHENQENNEYPHGEILAAGQKNCRSYKPKAGNSTMCQDISQLHPEHLYDPVEKILLFKKLQ